MGHGIYQYDKNLNEFKKIVKQDGTNLLIDDKENLWFTVKNKLLKFKIKTGVNKSFEFENSNYTTTFIVKKMKFGPDNNIWIADRQGVRVFNRETGTFKQLPSVTNKPISTQLISTLRDIAKNEMQIASLLKVGEGVSLKKEFILEKQTKVLILNVGEGRLTSFSANMFDYGWLEDSKGKIIWAADQVQNSFNAGGGYKNRIAFTCINLPKGAYSINFISDIGHSFGDFNVPSHKDSNWYGIQAIKIDDEQYSYLDDQGKNELDNTFYPSYEDNRRYCIQQKVY